MNQVEVLLVEDNPDDIDLALHAFRKNNLTNQIHVVRDGAEAIEFLLGQAVTPRPKLILLDLKLPKVGGLEVLRRIKQDERTRDIPVVVLTSSLQERDIVDSYGYGVNSYIVKPIDFQQFTDAVARLGFYWLLLNQGSEKSA